MARSKRTGISTVVFQLGERRPALPTDGLGRSIVGYTPGLSDQDIYQAGRGCWAANFDRIDTEIVRAVIAYRGVGLQVIHKTRAFEVEGGRVAIEGQIVAGGPEHDAFVGQALFTHSIRNPVVYLSTQFDHMRLCRCGCGSPIDTGEFLAGHSIRAIMERVNQAGGPAPFLDWFDTTFAA